MIEFLHIENIAVVKTLDIEFSRGLTALTGETGAGKSIIIDSLGLLRGDRADKELLRVGESRAEVSAVFGGLSDKICGQLEELGFGVSDGSVMLMRSFTPTSSSARLNGKPINLSMLREVSALLFGIHGQNDNMILLDAKNHLAILDSYAEADGLRAVYNQQYKKIESLRKRLDTLNRDTREAARMAEMLKFQIEDIEAVKPKLGEEEELEALAVRLRSAEKISKCASLVDKALNGGKGNGAIYLVDRAAAALDSVSDAIPEADDLARRLSDVKYELEDIAASLGILTDSETENPTAMLDRAEGRLDKISRLKRKYGNTVAEILEFLASAKEQLDYIENSDDRRLDIEDELRQVEREARAAAGALSECRRRAAHKLGRSVCETLEFLDMPKVRFEVSVEPSDDFLPSGTDAVEFLLSANPGEPLMPMSKIASGGELSRIMLSLKNVLNEADGIDTVIFDEIDTGISGKTARKVGIKLKEIGCTSQVLCVTHSAQIASLAHNHLYVSKHEEDGRTQSDIRTLDGGERVAEIARMLGGIEITERQTAVACELIEEGKKY